MNMFVLAQILVLVLSFWSCKTVRTASSLPFSTLKSTSYCSDLGLRKVSFEAVPEKTGLYDKAADFILPTTEGSFQLSEAYSGCDTYLIIQDEPKQTRDTVPSLWSRDAEALIKAMPRNTHVLFVASGSDSARFKQSLSLIQGQMATVLSSFSSQEAEHWRSHLHFVTKPLEEIPSWVGDVLRNPGWGVGIDRFQRIRYIGSFADPRRPDAKGEWFTSNLSMLANEAVYYNFEERREAALSAQNATVISFLKGEVIEDKGAQGKIFFDRDLPEAKDFAQFDGLEFDLYLACSGDGEYGVCPAWDSTVTLYLCDPKNESSCEIELGRWITTYHREGRWVIDASPLLPLLKGGGRRHFAFYSHQPYEVTLNMRLFQRHEDLRAFETIPLFTGGNFDTHYNENHPPKSLRVPPKFKKAELVTAITGHGMQEPGNCAEFCDTTHRFWLNGTAVERHFSRAGTEFGCMQEVDKGTVPNQYGTWWYGRSGWCPGREVTLLRQDVTALIRPGQDNEIRYEGFFQGKPYPTGGANFLVSSFLVFSEE